MPFDEEVDPSRAGAEVDEVDDELEGFDEGVGRAVKLRVGWNCYISSLFGLYIS